MTPDEYQQQVKRSLSCDYTLITSKLMKHGLGFASNPSARRIDILHAIIGCVTESAELMDAWKKNMFHDKPLDEENLKEEAGDLMWYVATLCNALGGTLEEIMAQNIAKLRKRYPDKFTNEAAAARADKAEAQEIIGQVQHRVVDYNYEHSDIHNID